MNIPFFKSKQKDIYDFGFGKSLTKELPNSSTGVVYDDVSEASNAAQVLSGGNLSLKTLTIGNFTRQVAPGDDLQAAIDAVNREGGGTVQLLGKLYILRQSITLRANVILAGAGKDITVLDFNAAGYGIEVGGTATATVQNFGIRDLTIRNSNAVGGIFISFAQYFRLDNVKSTLCLQAGIKLSNSLNFALNLVDCLSNTGDGLIIATTVSGLDSSNFTITNSTFNSNQLTGTSLLSVSKIITTFSFISCDFSGNQTDGLYAIVSGFPAQVTKSNIINCTARGNTGDGFDYMSSLAALTTCSATSNGGYGFNLHGSPSSFTSVLAYNAYVGNKSQSNTSGAFVLSSDNYLAEFIGNQAVVLGTSTSMYSLVSLHPDTFSVGNQPTSPRTEQKLMRMNNASGAIMNQGEVVVFFTSSYGDSVTYTSTNGDNKIFGMFVGGSGGTDTHNSILTEGFTPYLYVNNSATSISVGDWLSTASMSRYAKKAVPGEMVFAIALSTPTTGTAQIDALLVSPRTLTDATSSPVTSGVYTPTLTNVANLDASVTSEFQYHRVGNTVSFSGAVEVNPNTTATSTQLGISLPIASNFGAGEDCAGTAFSPTIAAQGAAIKADVTNDRMQMQWVAADVTAQSMYITGMYQVI